MVVIRKPEMAKKMVTPFAPFQNRMRFSCSGSRCANEWPSPSMCRFVWWTTTAIMESPRKTSMPSKRRPPTVTQMSSFPTTVAEKIWKERLAGRLLSQKVFERGAQVRLLITVLHDHRRVDAQPPLFSLALGHRARARNHHSVFGNDQRLLSIRAQHLTAHHVIHRRAPRENRSRRQHRAPAHDRPFVDAAVAAHQHIVFQNHRAPG